MAALDWSQCPAVESIPGKVSGAWVFKNTRMPVQTVFSNLQSGASPGEVMDWFDVERHEIEAALQFVIDSLEKPPSYRWNFNSVELLSNLRNQRKLRSARVLKISVVHRLALVILIFTGAAYAQTPSPSATPKQAPKTKSSVAPKVQNVYSQSWENGEIKSCSTYSGQPSLIECDGSKLNWDGAFINLLGNNASSGEEGAYDKAFLYALTHSKQFLVGFSEDPWPNPKTGRRQAMWDCTKDKVISCKLVGREK